MDIQKLREKQQKLMVQMVERKVRSRAQQLYDQRGQVEGLELQDWYQAESEVLGSSIVAPLYRRLRSSGQGESMASENLAENSSSSSDSAI